MKDHSEIVYKACYYSLYAFIVVAALMIVFSHT